MTNAPTRRTVAKTALWGAPAVAVAAAAPAIAASCNPATNVVTRAVSLTFANNATDANGNPSHFLTYTNSGSTTLPAGSTLTTIYNIGPVTQDVTVNPTTVPSNAKVTVAQTPVDATNGSTDTITFTTVLGQDFAPGQIISIFPNITDIVDNPVDNSGSDYSGGETGISVKDTTQSVQTQIVGCQTVTSDISVSS